MGTTRECTRGLLRCQYLTGPRDRGRQDFRPKPTQNGKLDVGRGRQGQPEGSRSGLAVPEAVLALPEVSGEDPGRA